MLDDITFMDLASLLKITTNTPMEKLGTALNATIFDASNIAGTLKQKGLIDFTANYPGPNFITITDTGKALIAEAESKSSSPLDALDHSLLAQMSGGKRLLIDLQNSLGIRAKDLAFRLYKLYRQNFIIYELRNGSIELLLTEQGFLQAKGQEHPASLYGQPRQTAAQQSPKPAVPFPAAAPQTQIHPQETPTPKAVPPKTPLMERPGQQMAHEDVHPAVSPEAHAQVLQQDNANKKTQVQKSKTLPLILISIVIVAAVGAIYYIYFH